MTASAGSLGRARLVAVLPLRAAMKLDLGEVLRSRWMSFCLAVYGVLGAGFVLIGLRESMVLGFTGLGRVLFSLCHALVLILPLLALTGSGPAIVRTREEGTLELWLSQPIGRTEWLVGVTAVRFLALTLPLAAVLLALAAWSGLVLRQPVPWVFVGRAWILCTALLWAFVGLGMATSVVSRSLARATTLLLLLWALAVALVDFALIGLLLQWQLPARVVFALAALNPVQAVRVALLAGAEPDLSVLGPAGFFLANELGPGVLLGLGIAWPFGFGTLAWLLGWRAFLKRDVV